VVSGGSVFAVSVLLLVTLSAVKSVALFGIFTKEFVMFCPSPRGLLESLPRHHSIVTRAVTYSLDVKLIWSMSCHFPFM
jgi:hypothetical protein